MKLMSWWSSIIRKSSSLALFRVGAKRSRYEGLRKKKENILSGFEIDSTSVGDAVTRHFIEKKTREGKTKNKIHIKWNDEAEKYKLIVLCQAEIKVTSKWVTRDIKRKQIIITICGLLEWILNFLPPLKAIKVDGRCIAEVVVYLLPIQVKFYLKS